MGGPVQVAWRSRGSGCTEPWFLLLLLRLHCAASSDPGHRGKSLRLLRFRAGHLAVKAACAQANCRSSRQRAAKGHCDVSSDPGHRGKSLRLLRFRAGLLAVKAAPTCPITLPIFLEDRHHPPPFEVNQCA